MKKLQDQKFMAVRFDLTVLSLQFKSLLIINATIPTAGQSAILFYDCIHVKLKCDSTDELNYTYKKWG